jgi:hypothetical protein
MKTSGQRIASGVVILLLALGVAYAQGRFAEAVTKVKDCVVTIVLEKSSGTGFIVNADGLILTSKHVLGDKQSAQVKLRSGDTLEAKLFKAASESDLCLLKVERKHLPAAQFAPSAALKQGDEVGAVGAPLGLENSVTKGVVSSVSREIEGKKYLQIDAALNHGNSGGPIINADGDVVGVATMIAKQAQNVGFAIPSETVLSFLEASGVSYQAALGEKPDGKPEAKPGEKKAPEASSEKPEAKSQPEPEEKSGEKNPLGTNKLWALLLAVAAVSFIVSLITSLIVSARRPSAPLVSGTWQVQPPGAPPAQQSWGQPARPAQPPPAPQEDLSDIDIELK